MTTSSYTELLRERNLKATSTRIDVLTVISEYSKAIPHTALQEALKGFDRVTLYRTLNVLIDSGIIHKAMADENETFYAICSPSCSTHSHNHHHIHFKCTQCNEVSCVHTDDPVSISIPGYALSHVEIQATGICASCLA